MAKVSRLKKIAVIVSLAFLIVLATNVFVFVSASAPQEKTQEAFVTALLESVREHTYWSENYHYQKWDCTNMSAVLYTVLSNFGIETKIVLCETNFCPKRDWHAMVKANIDGEWRMIEATWPDFVSEQQLKLWDWQPRGEYTLGEALKYYGEKEFGTLHVKDYLLKGDD